MEILKYGDKTLTQKSKPVDQINQDIIQLISEMKECLSNTPGGIGLAAPQVGVLLQLFIIDLSGYEGFTDKHEFIVINPEILEKSGSTKESEGCLSFPTITTVIKRYERLKIRYKDHNWKEKTIEIHGFLARAFQHEIDHLNGILIVDRVSPIKKQFINREVSKLKNLDEW